MLLAKVVFLTSAFGALPVALRVGSFSASAILTVLISGLAFMVFLGNRKLRLLPLRVIFPFALFFVISLAWYFLRDDSLSGGLVVYPFVWGGFLIILIAASSKVVNDLVVLKELNQFVNWVSYLYVAVLAGISAFHAEDPATTQVGVVFVAFHLARLLTLGRRESLLPVVLIMFFQTMLLARVVVGAEFLMFIFGVFFIYKPTMSRAGYLKQISAGVVLPLVLVFVFYYSGFGDKSVGGDQALEIGGVQINTSGRWYWWEIIFDSALKSPLLGYGSPIPDEMIGVDRWNHPHNDYLRIFHQMGLVGLFCWGAFVILSLRYAVRKSKNALVDESRAHFHSVILVLIGLSITMVTDNTLVYSYVMFPLGLLIGVQLAISGSLVVRGGRS